MSVIHKLEPAWPIERSGGITVDEFVELSAYFKRFELINGGIFKKPMSTFEHGTMAFLILKAYIAYDPTGEKGAMRQEVNFFLNENYSPAPDALFWKADQVPSRKTKIAPRPNLAIEIQSPNQSVQELTRKAWAYIAGGVEVVWVIQLDKKLAAIFKPGQTEPETIAPGGMLEAAEILPDFKIPLDSLYQE